MDSVLAHSISSIDYSIISIAIISGILVILLQQVGFKAWYGKFSTGAKSSLSMDGITGWIIMESTSMIVYFLSSCYFGNWNYRTILLFMLWQIHYIHRSIIYPLFRIHSMNYTDAIITALGFIFNSYNAFFNSKFASLSTSNYVYSNYLLISGLFLYIFGFVINYHSDGILIRLRSQKSSTDPKKRYFIPEGGFFQFVSCANYFGEAVEWTGFALVAQNFAAVAFAFYTCAFLGARALQVHQWYQHTFSNYPNNRKAFVPFLL